MNQATRELIDLVGFLKHPDPQIWVSAAEKLVELRPTRKALAEAGKAYEEEIAEEIAEMEAL